MSLKDSLFTEDLEEDIQHFLRIEKSGRVLVFPPVNNYRRFLIHQLVQERYAQLQTFSIGQGFARRTVICYKSDYIGVPKVNGVITLDSDFFGGKNLGKRMGIENQCTPTSSPENTPQRTRPVRSTPAQELYRPPAARKLRPEQSPSRNLSNEQTSPETCSRTNKRQKRPDRAVYVPRHRRSIPEVEPPILPSQSSQSKIPVEPVKLRPRINRNSFKEAKSGMENVEKQSGCEEEGTESNFNGSDEHSIEKSYDLTANEPAEIERDAENSECPVTVNNGKNNVADLSVDTEVTSTTADEVIVISSDSAEEMEENNIIDIISQAFMDSPSTNESTIETNETSEKSIDVDKEDDERDRRKSIETVTNSETDSPIVLTNEDNSKTTEESKTDESQSNSAESGEKMEEESSATNNIEKVKTKAFVSPVLIISTSKDEEEKKNELSESSPIPPCTPPEKKVKKVKKAKNKPVASPAPVPPPVPPPAPAVKLNRDECDWETLFDNGECLDPVLLEELTSAVGEVTIEQPKSSYKGFTRPVEVSNDEFAHVVEIYNFPSEFKTSDLAAVFSPFKNNGFELKWVDDTHCLGVFSSPLVAAEVLASEHPFVKMRPLSEASPLSKAKARRSSEFLQPYRTRPETCAALARRLVTKSLGVTLATARQEREQEKMVLREAKEKRRLANKQREDIWEGIITEKPTS